MYKKFLLGSLLVMNLSSLQAKDLNIKEGVINAHTEVFGDKNIDPVVKKIVSTLTMDKTIEDIKGYISIDAMDLVSEKETRDEHMHKLFTNKNVIFNIKNIEKGQDNNYVIKGYLNINGVDKEVSSIATISNTDTELILNGSFDIKLTDFKIEPPKMLFLTVRDLINIKYSLKY